MHIERVTQSMNLLKRIWFNGNAEAKHCSSHAMTVTFKSSPMFYSDKRCASFTQMTFYDVWWIYVSQFVACSNALQTYPPTSHVVFCHSHNVFENLLFSKQTFYFFLLHKKTAVIVFFIRPKKTRSFLLESDHKFSDD